jgi:hypothetical protein
MGNALAHKKKAVPATTKENDNYIKIFSSFPSNVF